MDKVENVHFSVVIVLCGTKMHSDSTAMKFQRSRLFADLAQRSLVSCLVKFSKDLN